MSSIPQLTLANEAANNLKQFVDKPDFYKKVGELDPANAPKWNKMEASKIAFQELEPFLEANKYMYAYNYSKAMRPTLQFWVIQKLGSFNQEELDAYIASGAFYDDFIKIHPQAFKQNGACSLFFRHPFLSAKILFAPIGTDVYTISNVLNFIKAFNQGLIGKDFKDAEEVRAAIEALSSHQIMGGYEETSEK